MVAARSVWAAPGDAASERRYAPQWADQANRDAGELVERGAVRPATRVLGEQDVARRLWEPVERQLRAQTRAIVRDARQEDRREQIRLRVNEKIEQRREQIEKKKEQRRRKKEGQEKPSSSATDRRPTPDPLSDATQRRIATETTASPTASAAAILNRTDRGSLSGRDAKTQQRPTTAAGNTRDVSSPIRSPTLATTPDQKLPTADDPNRIDLDRR